MLRYFVSGRVHSIAVNFIRHSFCTSTVKHPNSGKISSPTSSPKRLPRKKPDIHQSINRDKGTSANLHLIKERNVPYKFRIVHPELEEKTQWSRSISPEMDYGEFSGNRYPTLSTAENFEYWKDRGFDKLVTRRFPFKIPPHRKIHPLMRVYFHFLNSFDPVRFTESKIGERYGLKEKAIKKILEEFRIKKFMDDGRLGVPSSRRITREEAVAQFKENLYSDYVGYQFKGEDQTHSEKQTKGHKATSDWVNLQAIQVESMSSFPLMQKRDPSLKRVDVDLTVLENPKHKVMNWINPTEKVVI